MMIDKTKEQLITAGMVSPYLCKQMAELGIYGKSIFQWRRFRDGWRVWSYAFDVDNLYRDSDATIFRDLPLMAPAEVIPAWTISDLLKVLPPHLVTSSYNDYEFAMDDTYGNVFVKEGRLPDLYARAVIEMLRLPGFTAEWIMDKMFFHS